MSYRILIIDDELSILQSLSGALRDEGYEVATVLCAEEGMSYIAGQLPDFVFLDIWMPSGDGVLALEKIKKKWPELVVVMMSGHGTIETAVKATKLGAFDFIEKPLSLERVLVCLQNAIQLIKLTRENQNLRKQIEKNNFIIGESLALKQLLHLIEQIAPTSASVLITGENGTGKELVAKSLHRHSIRFFKPFIEINCAAIPDELIESELFGHEKGAFTGATQLRRGRFDLAHEGTLFLDEIGDMSLKTQAKILRILQEQKFERVGGSQTICVDVRIIAATNKDLKEEISKGKFREDLFYRLNVVPVYVPTLRERKEDIALIADFFIHQFAQTHMKKVRKFQETALKVLLDYSWPGNVRELKNLMERLIILGSSERSNEITASEVLEHLQISSDRVDSDQAVLSKNLRDARQDFEKEFILHALKINEGNVSKTAIALGIERTHLYRKIKLYSLE